MKKKRIKPADLIKLLDRHNLQKYEKRPERKRKKILQFDDFLLTK